MWGYITLKVFLEVSTILDKLPFALGPSFLVILEYFPQKKR